VGTHAHDWACEHWALEERADPKLPYSRAAGFPAFRSYPFILGGDREDYAPKEYELSLSHHTIAAVFRLDTDIPSQWKKCDS
jgi:hypothetical protein